MKKAITPVIAVVLLIMLSVAAGAGAFFFITSVQSTSSVGVSGGVGSLVGQSQGRLRVVSVSGDKVVVQNVGTTPVSGSVTTVMDGTATETGSEETLEPGEFAEVTVEGTGETNVIIGTTTISFTKTTTEPAVCGDGICETEKGENAENCFLDCSITDIQIVVYDDGWIIVHPNSTSHIKSCTAKAGGQTYYLNITESNFECSNCNNFEKHSYLENATMPYYVVTLPWTVDKYDGGTTSEISIYPYLMGVGMGNEPTPLQNPGLVYYPHAYYYNTSEGYLAYCTKNSPSRAIVEIYGQGMRGSFVNNEVPISKETTPNRISMTLYENGSVLFNYYNLTYQYSATYQPYVGVVMGLTPTALTDLSLDSTTYDQVTNPANNPTGLISIYCEFDAGSFDCSRVTDFVNDACPIDSLYFTAYGRVQTGTSNVIIECENEEGASFIQTIEQESYSTGGSYSSTKFSNGASTSTSYFNQTLYPYGETVNKSFSSINVPINAEITSATLTISGGEFRGEQNIVKLEDFQINQIEAGADSSNNLHLIYEFNSNTYYMNLTSGSWSTAIEIANDSPNYLNALFIEGSNIHLFYGTALDNKRYKNSTDFGGTWQEVNVYDINSNEGFGSISHAGNVFRSIRFDDNTNSLKYFNSTDNGGTWNDVTDVHTFSGSSYISDVTHYTPGQCDVGRGYVSSSRDNYLHLAILNSSFSEEYKIHPDYNIYYTKSEDNGWTWSEVQDVSGLTGSYKLIGMMDMQSSGDYVHLFWVDNRTGTFEVYYARSTDNGDNWESPVMLSEGDDIYVNDGTDYTDGPLGFLCDDLSAYASGSNVNVVWLSYDHEEGRGKELLIRKSTDNGANWDNIEKLSEVDTINNEMIRYIRSNNKDHVFHNSAYSTFKMIHYSGVEYPNNPWIDIGFDDSYEWTYSGRYSASQEVDITSALSDYLSTCKGHPCSIPIRAHSNDHGSLTLSSLTVNYDI